MKSEGLKGALIVGWTGCFNNGLSKAGYDFLRWQTDCLQREHE